MSADKARPEEGLSQKETTDGVFSEPLFSVQELRGAVRFIVVATAALGGGVLAFGGVMVGVLTVVRYLPKLDV